MFISPNSRSMVQFCCVVGCGNRSNREVKKFFRLPHVLKTTDKNSTKAQLILRRRSEWLLNISRIDLKDGDSSYSPGYIRVCSDHFYSGRPSELTDVENPDWAPTLKMGYSLVRMKGSKLKRAMLGFPPSPRKRRKADNKMIERRRPMQAKKQIVQRKKLSPVKQSVQKKKGIQYKKISTLKKKQIQAKHVSPQKKRVQIRTFTYEQDDKPYKSPYIHKITVDCIVPDETNVKLPDTTAEEESSPPKVKEEYVFLSDIKIEPLFSSVKDEPFM